MGWKTHRKFYADVDVGEEEGAFTIQLDGRAIRTPQGKPLRLPTRALADAVAGEWRAQEDDIRPDAMPITRLANTAADKADFGGRDFARKALAYGGSDLLCYRAEGPDDLVRRQNAVWDPLLDWAADAFGAKLSVTSGVIHVDQSDEAIAALTETVEALDPWTLTGLASAADASGSLIIGLAVARGRLDAEEAFEASQLDETHQIERWGLDAEAEARREALRADLVAAVRFLELCGTRPSAR